LPEVRGVGAATVEESPGVISALGLPSLEPETARRILGGESLLLEELFVELFDELPAELLELSSELDDAARRNFRRSGSLSLDELLEEDELDELLVLSSELDAARRRVGLLPLPDELAEDLLDELLSEDLPGSGFVSSVCSEASECSSGVPSFTMLIDAAFQALLLS